MYSGFAFSKRRAQQAGEVQRRVRCGRVARTASGSSDLYSTQSLARTSQWVQRNAGTKTAAVLIEGSTPLVHPDLHQFRDYSPIGSVYVRKYVCSIIC